MNVTRKLKGVELEPFLKISLFIWFDPYGYQGSTRGQLKCVGPSNAVNATEYYAAAGALVSLKIVNAHLLCLN